MKTTEPIRLSDAGSMIILDDSSKAYGIRVTIPDDPTKKDFVLVCMGQHALSKQASFTHPNLILKREVVHEFKTYLKGGGKRWHAKPGIDFYFAIPRSQITILPEKGYSYIPALINGVKVTLSVSGGGPTQLNETLNGWEDWLGEHVSTSIGYPLRTMKKIADVAVRGTGFEPIPFDDQYHDRPREEARFKLLMAELIVPKLLAEKWLEGNKPKVFFEEGWGWCGETEGVISEIRFAQKLEWEKQPDGSKRGKFVDQKRTKHYIILTSHGFVKVLLNQIDWEKTGKELALVGEMV